MTFDAHANFPVSTVATAPSPATSGTSLVVTSGQGSWFPATPFNAVACPPSTAATPSNAEVVRVTGRSTDTMTIVRAQESTSAQAIAVGWQFYAPITKKTLTDIESVASRILPFTRPGNLAVETGTVRMYFPVAATIVSVTAMVNTAPTGASIIVDVLKNGSTIFTTTSNRPTIAASGTVSSAAVPDITSLAVGDYLTLSIAQVGSTITGADLTVAVYAQ